MWSKQADARNANMTSFKNKITNRKPKNSQTGNSELLMDKKDKDSVCGDIGSVPTSGNKKTKSGRHRNRGNKKNSVSKDTDSSTTCTNSENNIVKEVTPPALTNDVHADDIILSSDLDLADVELRSKVPTEVVEEQNLKNQKRYSDSFVLENGCCSAQKNGFLINEDINANDKGTKKGRRFSDLFRHGTLKSGISIENLNLRQSTVSLVEKEAVKAMTGTKSKNSKKGSSHCETNKSTLSKEKKDIKNTEKVLSCAKPNENVTNSYLKRVKSKIYKTKCEADGVLPSKTTVSKKSKNCEIIPENVAVGTQSDLRKSSNFDFRLIRQSSNLEQIRSRTFGVQKSTSNTGIADLDDGITKKPMLAKAKSSSAINLNLLRMRRNRILEQVKERRCKDVFDEFDFIAFGGFRDKFGGSQKISITTDHPTQKQLDKTTPEGIHVFLMRLQFLIL